MDLPYKVEETEDTMESLVFFDTQGGDFPEKTEADSSEKRSVILGDSKSNEMEASLVGMHIQNLVAAGVQPQDIAIITPYNAQLAVLSQLLKEKYSEMEFGSVDGFQGREKEAVIVSLVRSNPEHEVGFLGEERRLNGRYLLSSFHSRGSNHHAGSIDDGCKDPMRGVGLLMSRCQECIRCRIVSLTTEFHSCHDQTQTTSRGYRRLGNSIKVRPLQVILEDGAFRGSEILTGHKTGVALS